MRKLIAVAALVLAFSMTGLAQFKFGAGAQLLFDGSSFGVGAKGNYTINEDWAAQGSFHYYFEDFTYWQLDFDGHYKGFDIGDVEGFQINPFAGLNLTSISINGFGDTSVNFNIGVNGTLPLDGGLEVYIEPKIILGDGSTFALGGGVYF